MNISVRVFYNTISLYGKMIVTTIITLYLTRVVLNYLGASDFGLYNLIGGVISLLSFVNSALIVSTQRYLSVAMGENDAAKVKSIFSSSILIHIILAIILIIIFELCNSFLFNGFLNIEPNRLHAAKIIYQIMIVSTVFTVLGVPYNALINAREDLWLFSIIEIICAILKLGIIIIFHYSKSDALITYTLWILVVTIINFLFKYIWCILKYKDYTKVSIIKKENIPLIKEMLGYSGWNAFGTLAIIGRNQGIAVLLNVFWGTAVNAVYGIANQVNSQLVYFSTMMTTSITPQIMKSYGEGNTSRMLDLSVFTCKLSFFLSAVFAIPLLLELPFVLKIWLNTVPNYTEIFCSLIIFMFLIMQLYPGLSRAIQASGKIQWYQVITSIALLLPIPVGVLFGQSGKASYEIIYLMVISQVIQMCIAIYSAKHIVKLKVIPFILFVFKAGSVFACVYIAGKFLEQLVHSHCNEWLSFFVIVIATILVFSIGYYFIVLSKSDKKKIHNVVYNLLRRNNS